MKWNWIKYWKWNGKICKICTFTISIIVIGSWVDYNWKLKTKMKRFNNSIQVSCFCVLPRMPMCNHVVNNIIKNSDNDKRMSMVVVVANKCEFRTLNKYKQILFNTFSSFLFFHFFLQILAKRFILSYPNSHHIHINKYTVCCS